MLLLFHRMLADVGSADTCEALSLDQQHHLPLEATNKITRSVAPKENIEGPFSKGLL